ncbi:tetratricopeptide repeat protein [Nonomuraea purpurea]|uniref:Tetratricopeptide repeat protein n=1 Tax=Nonomuraea purpurea TaxID=1849276 RepID=A0ABV8GKT9_9ACTN
MRELYGPGDGLEKLRAAASEGRPGAARELGHRLSIQWESVDLRHPGDVPEGEQLLRRTLDQDPGDADTAVLLACLLRQQSGEIHESLWSRSFPPSSKEQGEPEAIDDLWADPPGSEKWREHAHLRLDEAERWYRHVLDLDPDHEVATAGLASMLAADCGDWNCRRAGRTKDKRLREEHFGEAARWWRRHLAIAGDSDLAAGALAGCLSGRGSSEEVALWRRRAVEAAPQNWWAAMELALTTTGQEDRSDIERRRQEFSTAEQRCRGLADAGDPQAVYSLALLLDATGREDEADRLLRRPTTAEFPLDLHHTGWDQPGAEPARWLEYQLNKHGDHTAAQRWNRRAAWLKAAEPEPIQSPDPGPERESGERSFQDDDTPF